MTNLIRKRSVEKNPVFDVASDISQSLGSGSPSGMYIHLHRMQRTASVNLEFSSTLFSTPDYPAETSPGINVGLTLVQRRRRWTNVKPTLIQRPVSAGTLTELFFAFAYHKDRPTIVSSLTKIRDIYSGDLHLHSASHLWWPLTPSHLLRHLGFKSNKSRWPSAGSMAGQRCILVSVCT